MILDGVKRQNLPVFPDRTASNLPLPVVFPGPTWLLLNLTPEFGILEPAAKDTVWQKIYSVTSKNLYTIFHFLNSCTDLCFKMPSPLLLLRSNQPTTVQGFVATEQLALGSQSLVAWARNCAAEMWIEELRRVVRVQASVENRTQFQVSFQPRDKV